MMTRDSVDLIRSRRARAMRLGVGVVALAVASTAHAMQVPADQQVPAVRNDPVRPASGTSSSSRDTNEGEIVVTAQRREQALQDVPISVTALTGETLVKSGIQSTEALSQVTPGLNFTRLAYFAQPYIRGVGSSSTSVGDEPNVATYIDGVYISSLEAGFLDLLNVRQVEVLKGPQGTLFGRNATGGAISISTIEPSQDFEARFRGSYGRFNEYRAQGFVNGGLAPGLAVNLAGSISGRDSYIRNLTLNEDGIGTRNWSIRGRAKWDATENLSFDLIGNYSRNRSSDGLNPFVVGRNSVGEAQGYDTTTSRFGTVLSGVQPLAIVKQRGVSLKSQLDLDPFTIISISSWSKHSLTSIVDSDQLPPVITHFQQTDFARDLQEDFRIQSNSGSSISWLVGAFYFDGKSGYNPLLAQVPFTLRLDSRQKTRAYAFYADVTVPIMDKLELTGGLRYSNERKRLDQIGSVPAFGLNDIPSGERTVKFDSFTPRAVLSYKPNSDVLLYASYSKGFKSGGFNQSSLTFLFTGGALQDPPYDPEKLDAYEIGLKTSFDTSFGRGTFNIAAFHYDYADLQAQLIDPSSGTARIENAAKARMNGVEVEATLAIHSSLRLRAGAAYLDAKYRDYDALVTIPRPSIGTGRVVDGTLVDCPVAVPAGAGCGNYNAVLDVSGRQMVKAPKLTLTGGIDHTAELGGDYRLESTINLYSSSSFPWEPSGRFRAPKYGTVNLQTELHFPGDRFSVGGYLRNLTDRRAQGNGQTDVNSDRANYIDPRTYGVIVTAKF